jgi:hypothetical protein
MGLPVFKNKQYMESLKELLESNCFDKSFNFEKFNQQEYNGQIIKMNPAFFDAYKFFFMK